MKTLLTLLTSLFCVGVALSSSADEKTNAAPTKITHVDGKEAGKLVAKGDVTVIDVRTPAEFETVHIAGATNINYRANDFAAQIGKLDREKTYLVHCAVGARSTSSLPQFEKLGFKHIIHLDGGMKAYQAAGNPVEKK